MCPPCPHIPSYRQLGRTGSRMAMLQLRMQRGWVMGPHSHGGTGVSGPSPQGWPCWGPGWLVLGDVPCPRSRAGLWVLSPGHWGSPGPMKAARAQDRPGCSPQVDPKPFYEACVHDSCSCDTGGDCECFCSAVASYAQECTKEGACVFWRTPDLCRKSPPELDPGPGGGLEVLYCGPGRHSLPIQVMGVHHPPFPRLLQCPSLGPYGTWVGRASLIRLRPSPPPQIHPHPGPRLSEPSCI